MTVFEVGTSRHPCVSGICVIFTFHQQEVSGFMALRPNRQKKVICMHIIVVGQSLHHCPSVYRRLENVRSLVFLRSYH